ncbi:amidohydrolase [Amycolatopsis acidicola]|uniref:Amidohydrolase n=1 Tax=Amycolatopsis acidicola TaxID=2596893 RepID=A0A5N0V0Y9_9PSEU|nr:amidohydrolase family protein [Amycolatopsis acidicola]KAA9160056.1 amidohydrolase [Amycolatopsis acidicola]
MTAPVIDIHPHVISEDRGSYPLKPLGGRQSGWSAARPLSGDALLRAMDDAGVARAAIVQTSTAYGFDNSYVADVVAAHPGRLTGVCSIDVLAENAVDVLRTWVEERGMTGLRLFTTGSTMPGQADWLDDERTFPVWAWAEAHDIPVCVQMTPEGQPRLRNLLRRFPAAKVILDHLTQPSIESGPPYPGAATLFELADYDNVYLKVTTENFQHSRDGAASPETWFGRIFEVFGARRIAWGSNFPAAEGTLPELVGMARDQLSFLSAEDADWVFSRTAQSLYPVLASVGAAR